MADENKQPLADDQLEGVSGGNIGSFVDKLLGGNFDPDALVDTEYTCDGCGAKYHLSFINNEQYYRKTGGNYCADCLHARGVV